MATSFQAAVSRLTGHDSDDDRNGGLPLPALFEPILWSAYQGAHTIDEFVTAVKSRYLGRKEKRLRYMYGVDDPWPLLMTDAINLLVEQKLLISNGDHLVTGPCFALDTKLLVIEEPSQTVTVLSEARRDAGRSDALGMDISATAAKLYAGGSGLRKTNEKHVAELVRSMQAGGYHEASPLVFDQHGRLLDGRHRQAAAEIAGCEPTEFMMWVESDYEAVQYAWWRNKAQKSWGHNDVVHLTSLLGGHPDEILNEMAPQAKRAAQAILDAEPGLTQRDIAAAAGVTRASMWRAQEKLQDEGHDIGLDSRQVKHDRIAKAIAENPGASNRKIAEFADVSHPTVAAYLESLARDPGQTFHPGSQPESSAKPIKRKQPKPKKGPERSWRVKWHGDWTQLSDRILFRLKKEPFIARQVYEGLDAWRGWDDPITSPGENEVNAKEDGTRRMPVCNGSRPQDHPDTHRGRKTEGDLP